MSKQYILSLDSGTSSNRALLFRKDGSIAGLSQKEFPQIYPEPGLVEHDALEIWKGQCDVIQDLLQKTAVQIKDIASIGITNQRETTLLWDKDTAKPVYNAIVWQDRRTAPLCEQLKEQGLAEAIRKKTGLVIDSYFAATKIRWILDNVPSIREKARQDKILFGTIDTWLIWMLSEGKLHISDYSNASRSMLFNIHEKTWDDELLELLDIPQNILPEVHPSSKVYGTTQTQLFDAAKIPIAGIGGDQQAALFGQCCFEKGMVKNTYGTGCFILMHTGNEAKESKKGLLTTMACSVEGNLEYALEGSVFSAGSTIQWLRDELGLIENAAESEAFAKSVKDNLGVYLVPAFTGLAAPYWDMYARGSIVGLTRGTRKQHIVRAGLESLCYQTNDVLRLMEEESHITIEELKVDGGAAANSFLLQFQSDISNVPVLRSKILESTALGAAFLAGLAVEFWGSQDELRKLNAVEQRFSSQINSDKRNFLYSQWLRAVERSRHWIQK